RTREQGSAVRRALRDVRRGRCVRTERRRGLHSPVRPRAARARAEGSRGGGRFKGRARAGRRGSEAGRDRRGRLMPRKRSRPVTKKAGASHKLWGGRFASGPHPALDAVNRSIGVDFRLWPHDVRLSKAWAAALAHAKVLTARESAQIIRGLDGVAARIADGAKPIATDEDVHTMIDRLLHDEAGAVASRLHTGRSRNDQVATATRLWTMEACGALDVLIVSLQRAMLDQATRLQRTVMPAYTHMQRAQPVSGAHWMLSHFWPLQRDRERLAAARAHTATLPLGSGAIAGSAFPIVRTRLAKSLGFP